MPKQVVYVVREGKRKKGRLWKDGPDAVEEDMKVTGIKI
jgi:hypothetical protein